MGLKIAYALEGLESEKGTAFHGVRTGVLSISTRARTPDERA